MRYVNAKEVTSYFEDGGVKLYCGDCVEVMNQLIDEGVKVDKVITSPPYNITRSTDDQGYDLYKDGMPNDDYIRWTLEVFDCYDRMLNENGCILYNMSYGSENTEVMNLTVAEILRKTDFTLADILVWKKKNAQPNNVSKNKVTRICEYVYVFCRRSEFDSFTTNKKSVGVSEKGQTMYENVTNFFCCENNDGAQDLNKATFSTAFVKHLMNMYVREDDIVLDSFCGTGTTLNACLSLGIEGIGIELSEAQCQYAKERLSSGVQTSLF